MIKKLDKLLVRSFVTPFVAAFGVVLLLLVLQFLAKYIDDIAGRGLSSWVMAKIFLLSCATLITMALPLGVLLASLSTMGNLGENYELAAAKSGGISLVRLVRPLFFSVVLITTTSMLYSFYLQPQVNLKLYSLLTDVSRVKPSFALKPDHFYSDIDGYVIYVSDIDRDKDMLYQVQIFDHSQEMGNMRVCIADSGMMVRNDTMDYLFLNLYHGVSHEADDDKEKGTKKYEYRRFYFDTLQYKIKLTGFDLQRSDESNFAPHHYMKNIHELAAASDSIGHRIDTATRVLAKEGMMYTHFNAQMRKDIHRKPKMKLHRDSSILSVFDKNLRLEILTKTLNNCRSLKNLTTICKDRVKREVDRQRRYDIEFHYRIELPVSCIVFLFIGASLGAIVRKGGLGYPVLFSVLFFIIFYVLMIQGRKFARDAILPVWGGVWLPVLVMLPFAILFTLQAATEAPFFDRGFWAGLLQRTWRRMKFWKRATA